MSANPVHIKKFVFVTARRKPFGFHSRAGADEQHIGVRALAQDLVADRDGGE
jgi:hypothetical protein